ncbi:MAG: DUF4388 domain-containing protein [Desulfobacterales bacterium]|nr:DUF4388 domain-containing protein [Desulfobacterales bacterium]
MHLKGNFETSFLASILQLLCNDKKTGVLRLIRDENEVKIFMKHGAVIYATGSKKEARLGYLLRNKGIISSEQLNTCLALAKEKKLALGEIMVVQGYISKERLKEIIYKQAEDIIFDLFLWEKGSFEYKDAKLNLNGMVVTPLNIMNIVLEATRRVDEMSLISKQITNDRLIFKISQSNQDKKEIKFNADEWRILTLVDGKRTVRQLMNESGYDDFTVYKVLYSLISYGLIEKNEEIDFVNKEVENGYSEIIKQYYAVTGVIYRHFLNEAGRWTFTVIDEWSSKPIPLSRDQIKKYHEIEVKRWAFALINGCKSELSPQQKKLLENFHPNTPIETNIHKVLEALESFKGFEDGRIFLLKSFKIFIASILNKAQQILEPSPFHKMVQEIKKNFDSSHDSQKFIFEENNVINDIQSLFAMLTLNDYTEKPGSRSNAVFLVTNIKSLF